MAQLTGHLGSLRLICHLDFDGLEESGTLLLTQFQNVGSISASSKLHSQKSITAWAHGERSAAAFHPSLEAAGKEGLCALAEANSSALMHSTLPQAPRGTSDLCFFFL